MTSLGKVCEECRPGETCWHTVASVAPRECLPCRYCGKSDEMYSEMPVNGDWGNFGHGPNGRGFVMRIGCLCDASSDADKWRSEFRPFLEAIAEWNEMQMEAGQ